MAIAGSSERFYDDTTTVSAEALNSLDQGGNVYPSAVGGLKVDISPVKGIIDTLVVDYAGVTEQALSGSTTSYLYLDSTGSLVVNTSGFPTWGDGTSQERYFPLATVVTLVSSISTITDSRFKFRA